MFALQGPRDTALTSILSTFQPTCRDEGSEARSAVPIRCANSSSIHFERQGRTTVIQVIYRWKVVEANRSGFIAAWSKTTQLIRDSTEGARGSFCIVNVNDLTDILTIARWDRLEQWRAFVKAARSSSMSAMHALGEQISHTAYEQIGDHTI